MNNLTNEIASFDFWTPYLLIYYTYETKISKLFMPINIMFHIVLWADIDTFNTSSHIYCNFFIIEGRDSQRGER